MVQLTVNYKGVDYNVKCEIDEIGNYIFYVNDEYLTTVGGDGTEESIPEFAYDCIGGWVEGYEIYSLSLLENDVEFNKIFGGEEAARWSNGGRSEWIKNSNQ